MTFDDYLLEDVNSSESHQEKHQILAALHRAAAAGTKHEGKKHVELATAHGHTFHSLPEGHAKEIAKARYHSHASKAMDDHGQSVPTLDAIGKRS